MKAGFAHRAGVLKVGIVPGDTPTIAGDGQEAQLSGQLHLGVGNAEVEHRLALLEPLKCNRRHAGAGREPVITHPLQALLHHLLIEARGPGIVAEPGDANRMSEGARGDVDRIKCPGPDPEVQGHLPAASSGGLDRQVSPVESGGRRRGGPHREPESPSHALGHGDGRLGHDQPRADRVDGPLRGDAADAVGDVAHIDRLTRNGSAWPLQVAGLDSHSPQVLQRENRH